MNNVKKPIGVFDSGIGGLTVLEKLMEKFPNEDFIYVADQGHCPYGTKTEEGIKECVLNVGRYLIAKDVKAIVIETKEGLRFKISYYPSYGWINISKTMSYYQMSPEIKEWIEVNIK